MDIQAKYAAIESKKDQKHLDKQASLKAAAKYLLTDPALRTQNMLDDCKKGQYDASHSIFGKTVKSLVTDLEKVAPLPSKTVAAGPRPPQQRGEV